MSSTPQDYSSYGKGNRESGKTFAYLMVLLFGLHT